MALFTAITRSKTWARILGVGSATDRLIKEYQEIAGRDFRLEFTYPDREAHNRLRVINRDLGPAVRSGALNIRNRRFIVIGGLATT
jgi:superfamily I DNA and RNA helicase